MLTRNETPASDHRVPGGRPRREGPPCVRVPQRGLKPVVAVSGQRRRGAQVGRNTQHILCQHCALLPHTRKRGPPPGMRAANQRQPAPVPAVRAAGGGARHRRRRGARRGRGGDAGGPDGGARRSRHQCVPAEVVSYGQRCCAAVLLHGAAPRVHRPKVTIRSPPLFLKKTGRVAGNLFD